jgi:hypothetical protein
MAAMLKDYLHAFEEVPRYAPGGPGVYLRVFDKYGSLGLAYRDENGEWRAAVGYPDMHVKTLREWLLDDGDFQNKHASNYSDERTSAVFKVPFWDYERDCADPNHPMLSSDWRPQPSGKFLRRMGMGDVGVVQHGDLAGAVVMRLYSGAAVVAHTDESRVGELIWDDSKVSLNGASMLLSPVSLSVEVGADDESAPLTTPAEMPCGTFIRVESPRAGMVLMRCRTDWCFAVVVPPNDRRIYRGDTYKNTTCPGFRGRLVRWEIAA